MRRDEPLAVLQGWLGVLEPNHKFIVDIYNDFFTEHGNRPRGYVVTYTDAWCATGLSSSIIEAGGAMDAPLECGCQEMINLYKEAGRYTPGSAFVPERGDVIFYDWQGDGHADHVGMVEACDGTNIVAIECNCDDAVKRRTLRVGASYITGYGHPNYNEQPQPAPTPIPEHITPDPLPDAEHVYRLYNPTTGEHFYTASVDEGNNLIDAGWSYEGSAWIAPKESPLPVYRLINEAGGHIYTPDADEKRVLVESGWREEGVAFYARPQSELPNIPIYRAYCPGNGDHIFCANATEYYSLLSVGWNSEGIRFYGLR